jgi:hypothetical protein
VVLAAGERDKDGGLDPEPSAWRQFYYVGATDVALLITGPRATVLTVAIPPPHG